MKFSLVYCVQEDVVCVEHVRRGVLRVGDGLFVLVLVLLLREGPQLRDGVLVCSRRRQGAEDVHGEDGGNRPEQR
jgi:hypothetical protein